MDAPERAAIRGARTRAALALLCLVLLACSAVRYGLYSVRLTEQYVRLGAGAWQ